MTDIHLPPDSKTPNPDDPAQLTNPQIQEETPIGQQQTLEQTYGNATVQDEVHGIDELKGDPENFTQPRLKKILKIGKRVLQETVIHLEVNPLTNAPIRYAVAGATLKATKDPYLAATAYGASTVALEGGAGLATADVLSSDNKESTTLNLIKKALDHKSVQKFVVTKDQKLLPVSEALLAVYAGTSIVMSAKEGEEAAAKRTHTERRKYGIKTAFVVGAICTAQATLLAAGLDNYQDPKIVVPIAAAAVGANLGVRKVKKRLKNEKLAQDSLPRYDLSPDEVEKLEAELVETVEKSTKKLFRSHKPGIYGVWLSANDKFTNILRTREAEYFPEVAELSGEDEQETLFLALVDTRDNEKRVVHASTVSGVTEKTKQDREDGKSGFITIDQLIEKGNFTTEEFRNYYLEQGIDVESSISVDTNYRIGSKSILNGIKSGDLAYKTLVQLLLRREKDAKGELAVFASINKASIDSFNALGIKCELLMGRDDFVTPESEEGKEFHPVAIIINEEFKKIFESIDQVPELDLT